MAQSIQFAELGGVANAVKELAEFCNYLETITGMQANDEERLDAILARIRRAAVRQDSLMT